MRAFILFLIVWLVPHAGPAFAASEPVFAPVPDWVELLPSPEADPGLRDRHYQTLLVNHQSLYGAEHNDHFEQSSYLVQTTQGLQSVGDIQLSWQPDHQDLIIHAVRIRRGENLLDQLAAGQQFTVLRRENNLESAMLDGTLTAVMQVEGLEIGDILEVAYTIRRRGGALPLRGENYFTLPSSYPYGRYRVREIWPTSMQMQWTGRGRFEGPQVRRTRLGTELVVDLSDVELPPPPEQAPARYVFPDTLQLTEFREWSEVSRLLAPHYAQASSLGAESPLRAQVDRIAAASADPRVRAMAALRLVQEDIRYFALFMGDGNYLPATADQTWARRYGDCKGKTVTLLAVLRALGIEAEPVLVHSSLGDSLPERLPQLLLFDHVIVRARIDGRSYWLDGTRNGDRSLEELASSTFQHGLPLRVNGAELEAMPYIPPRQAMMEVNGVVDASGGFADANPFTAEIIFRGEMATVMRLGLAQMGREEFLRTMRENDTGSPGEESQVTSAEVREEAETGNMIVLLRGTTRMTWSRTPGAPTYRYRLSNEIIDWDADFERPQGQSQDAPFALPVPVNLASTETVILPGSGHGFRVEGESFERTVAGTRIGRTLSLENGRAVARSTFVRLERELPAAMARASIDALREITDDAAFVIAPASAMADADQPNSEGGAASESDASASDLAASGFTKLDSGELGPALADFDRAIALAPDWARPRAGRGGALMLMGRTAEAEAALADAMRRDQADFVVHQAYGKLHLLGGRPEDAVPSFTRALELEPGSPFALVGRAEAYAAVGRFDEAMTDLDALVTAQPAHVGAYVMKARIHLMRNEPEATVAAAEAAVRASADNTATIAFQAQMLRRLGRGDAASSAFDRALASSDAQPGDGDDEEERLGILQWRSAMVAESGDTGGAIAMLDALLRDHPDHAMLLNSRCWTRAIAGIELDLALADCDRAVAADPRNAAILDSRAMVKLRLGRLEEAITDASAALALAPTLSASLYVRGVARLRNGDSEGAVSDLGAARRIQFDIDLEYRDYGVTPDTPVRLAQP